MTIILVGLTLGAVNAVIVSLFFGALFRKYERPPGGIFPTLAMLVMAGSTLGCIMAGIHFLDGFDVKKPDGRYKMMDIIAIVLALTVAYWGRRMWAKWWKKRN